MAKLTPEKRFEKLLFNYMGGKIEERREFSEEFRLIKRDKDYDIAKIKKVLDSFRNVWGERSARFQDIDELIKDNLTSI